MEMPNQQHAEVMERISAQLAPRVSGIFSDETVRRFVSESYTALARRATVGDYLPLLVERFASDRLEALAQAEGIVHKHVPEVLFVCVHNAGRSQMAAAMLRHLAAGGAHARSAGSRPTDHVHPAVVEALEEWGIDIAREFPKPLTDEVVRAADVVVSMGCGDACPVYAGKRYLEWSIEDPAGKSLEAVRHVRDVIRTHVEGLLDELLAPVA